MADIDLKDLLTGLTEDTTPDTAADYVITYDASANALKKVKLTNLGAGGGGGGGIGGSTGSTDNAILRADGTGGATAQGSKAVLDDTGGLTLGDASNNASLQIYYGGGVKLNFDPSNTALMLQNGIGIQWRDIGVSFVADIGLARSAAGVLKVTDASTGGGKLQLIQATPSASTDAGQAGTIWTDASYIYVQTASGTIKRAALSTF